MSNQNEQRPVVARVITKDEEAELRNRAIGQSRLEAQANRRTDTVSGGFYLDPSGNPVDANGAPITDRSIEELEAERDRINAELGPLPYA